MTIQDVHGGIKARLDTISTLNTFAYQPAAGVYPCAFPSMPEVDYHRAMQGGLRQLEYQVVLFVDGFEQQSRTENVTAYIEPDGPSSIRAAIEADATLGGAAQDCIVSNFTPFGLDEMAGYQAIGGTFSMTVLLA